MIVPALFFYVFCCRCSTSGWSRSWSLHLHTLSLLDCPQLLRCTPFPPWWSWFPSLRFFLLLLRRFVRAFWLESLTPHPPKWCRSGHLWRWTLREFFTLAEDYQWLSSPLKAGEPCALHVGFTSAQVRTSVGGPVARPLLSQQESSAFLPSICRGESLWVRLDSKCEVSLPE